MRRRRSPTYGEGQQFYSISVVAKMLSTHPQTLRMYERLGLVKPHRNEHGSRLYSDRDIERIRKIQELTQGMGVNLAGVEVVFKLMERIEELETELKRLRKRFWKVVQEEAEKLAAQLIAERWEEFLRKKSFPMQVWRGSPIAKRTKISLTPTKEETP